jgi:hypothetical protein
MSVKMLVGLLPRGCWREWSHPLEFHWDVADTLDLVFESAGMEAKGVGALGIS